MKNREIPELIEADSYYREKRNETRKALEKVKKLEAKFYFLDRIVLPRMNTDTKKDDVELEYAILDLFKSIGFKCEKPKSDSDVDVKIKFKDNYFGLEVKNGNMPEITRIFQPEAHKTINKDNFNSIIVYNNAKTNQNWDSDRKIVAVKHGIGLLLTTELKKGYIKLKNSKITFDQFLNQLKQTGEIKFSRKELNKAHKSEAS